MPTAGSRWTDRRIGHNGSFRLGKGRANPRRISRRLQREADESTVSTRRVLVPILKLRMGTPWFPRQKRAIFREIKEIKGFRGGVLLYAAQGKPQIDAELAEKRRFWTGTCQVRH